MSDPVGLGIVGTGDILDQFMETFAPSDEVDVRFLAGRDVARAAERAAQFGVPAHGTYDELLADPTVGLVVNLTVPQAHYELTRAALVSGRHVWSEKPLAVSMDEGRELVELAEQHEVRLGCAPDTFLGPGLQTGLALIEAGRIGIPRSAHARFQYCGPDYWHPNPSFFFAHGGGPLLDMGPYYLTALVQALGPIARVTAVADRARDVRVVAMGSHAAEAIPVEVPTHVLAIYTFASGAIADFSISFDTALFASELEISGTEGSIRLPDPNRFDGDTIVFPFSIEQTSDVVSPGTTGGSGRGSGIVDMVRAIRDGGPHRTDGRLALHVLDVMMSTIQSADTGLPVVVESRCTPASLLPSGWTAGAPE
ncbi:Gfo/Idh/MocA family protein [Cellulomonas sp. McL0617]|uniref:Gfo/Idh/MocA family protein n=1 Tax=Cellulomonas sp. McL0617 TaxID=3415675 RepID=UPI003CFAE749